MKEIKTIKYLKKEAQGGELPGDPSLPPGVTQQMIDERFKEEIPIYRNNIEGEIEIPVNWSKINSQMKSLGYNIDGAILSVTSSNGQQGAMTFSDMGNLYRINDEMEIQLGKLKERRKQIIKEETSEPLGNSTKQTVGYIN